MSEEEMITALKEAHGVIKEIIELQNELISSLQIDKDDVIIKKPSADLLSAITDMIETKIKNIVLIKDKQERSEAKNELLKTLLIDLENSFPDQEKDIKSVVDDLFKREFREQILSTGMPVMGVRQLIFVKLVLKLAYYLELMDLLFSLEVRPKLCRNYLGSKSDEMIIDSMDEDYKKSYYLHYNFPPYRVGEVGRIGFTGRREIGHGNLAQRALKPVLPDYDNFPYTIRIVSEIMESNGSSSMASVCGGSLSLMSAGAPLKSAVAGIAMGLITDGSDMLY